MKTRKQYVILMGGKEIAAFNSAEKLPIVNDEVAPLKKVAEPEPKPVGAGLRLPDTSERKRRVNFSQLRTVCKFYKDGVTKDIGTAMVRVNDRHRDEKGRH